MFLFMILNRTRFKQFRDHSFHSTQCNRVTGFSLPRGVNDKKSPQFVPLRGLKLGSDPDFHHVMDSVDDREIANERPTLTNKTKPFYIDFFIPELL